MLLVFVFAFLIPFPVYASIQFSGSGILGYFSHFLPYNTKDTNFDGEVTVQELITYYSALYDVDYDLAYGLAKFESRLNPLAKNPRSSASGVYQFIRSTFKAYCSGDVFDADDNVKCAVRMLSEGKIDHWLKDYRVLRFPQINDLLK